MRENQLIIMLEVREETMKGKEKAFINCHSLLQQLSLSLQNQTQPYYDLKREKYKEKKKKIIYTALLSSNFGL